MARFFIDRPIFAWVIALVIMLAGGLSIMKLPIAQYPTIAPPAVGGPKAEREQQAVRRGDAGSAVPGKPEQDGAPHVSVSPKCSPEPCVKGLRYGKPLRTTDAYTYVNGRPPRRFDKFMMLAVAAALVALAAILYGYLRERRVEQQERQYIEQLVPDAETAGAADAADPAQE